MDSYEVNAYEWLNRVGLGCYAEVFLANFSVPNQEDPKKLINVKKFAEIRQNDFPKMNITNFNHQKLLMELIKSTCSKSESKDSGHYQEKDYRIVNYEKIYLVLSQSPNDLDTELISQSLNAVDCLSPFTTPSCKVKLHYIERALQNELEINCQTPSGIDRLSPLAPSSCKISLHSTDRTYQPSDSLNLERQDCSNHADQHKSFRKSVWGSIKKFRSEKTISTLEKLRSGRLEPLPKANARTDKALYRALSDVTIGEHPHKNHQNRINYGNRAHLMDSLQHSISALKDVYLEDLIRMVPCEVANVLFVNHMLMEMSLFVNGHWYRMPMANSIAGVCASTAEVLNVADAYADPHFNRSIDKITGFHTKNMLCQPIRTYHGSGRVVAVLEMINKTDGTSFDDQDIQLIAGATHRLSDHIFHQFKDLLQAAESFQGMGELVYPPADSPIKSSTETNVDVTVCVITEVDLHQSEDSSLGNRLKEQSDKAKALLERAESITRMKTDSKTASAECGTRLPPLMRAASTRGFVF